MLIETNIYVNGNDVIVGYGSHR